MSTKNINIKNAIFVIKTNGKMYITPDRFDDNRVKYDDGSVLCHHSFVESECFFAGLITIENGIPVSICNESGTFFPSMSHTVRIRNIFANILNMTPSKIALDFVIMEEYLEDQIIDLLNNNFGEEVEKLINNCASKGAQTYCNIMYSAIDKSKKRGEDNKCIICTEKQKNVLFLPCKHITTCMQCSQKITDGLCPLCRCKIDARVDNVFI